MLGSFVDRVSTEERFWLPTEYGIFWKTYGIPRNFAEFRGIFCSKISRNSVGICIYGIPQVIKWSFHVVSDSFTPLLLQTGFDKYIFLNAIFSILWQLDVFFARMALIVLSNYQFHCFFFSCIGFCSFSCYQYLYSLLILCECLSQYFLTSVVFY